MLDPRWYYAEDGAERGPVDQTVFDDLIESGEVGPDTLVWREGMSRWRPARDELPVLGAQSRPPPPLGGHMAAGVVAQGDGGPARRGDTTFVACVRQGWTRYAEFRGRSNRAEFWWLSLALVIAGLLVGSADAAIFGGNAMDTGPLGIVWSLATLIPSLAVGIRRLHDTGRTGWWMLLVLVPVIGWVILLILFCLPGEPQRNAWG